MLHKSSFTLQWVVVSIQLSLETSEFICYIFSFLNQYNPCKQPSLGFSPYPQFACITLGSFCSPPKTTQFLIQMTKRQKTRSRQIIKLFLELIHQVAVDVTVVVCAEDSDRSDPLRITQFVAPPQVYHLISSLIISLHLL